MEADAVPLTGPDLTRGVDLSEVPDGGMLVGHANREAVVLARRAGEASAVGATRTHYGAPLVGGLVLGGEVRCPWRHARFRVPRLRPT